MTPPAPNILRPRTDGAEYLISTFLPLMVAEVSAGGLCATPTAAIMRIAGINRVIKPSISRRLDNGRSEAARPAPPAWSAPSLGSSRSRSIIEVAKERLARDATCVYLGLHLR